MKKVYCKQCRYYSVTYRGVLTVEPLFESCEAPGNFKDTYLEECGARKLSPKRRNRANDCSLYEPKAND
jgi:hypothetical protein